MLAHCVLWNNEQVQLTTVAVPSVCLRLCSKDLVVIPLLVIAVLHPISNLACLPWFSYSSDFCSLSFEDTPPPRLPDFNWFRKRSQLCLQIRALSVVRSFASLLL